MIIITRNEHDYGPFDERVVAQYVEEGRLLLHDKARDAETGQEGIVKEFLLRKASYRKSVITEHLASSSVMLANLSIQKMICAGITCLKTRDC